MPEPLHILVLGDSALAGFGAVFDTALDLFTLETAWDRPLHFDVLASAGMTSADASIHLSEASQRKRYQAVIICLGPCDACGYGPLKGRDPLWLEGWFARRRETRYRRGHSLRRRNRPYHWAHHPLEGAGLRRCLTPRQHGEHLSAMMDVALGQGMVVVLVVPVATTHFPPCNNIGNQLFYQIFNTSPNLPLQGVAIPELMEALAQHQRGAWSDAERSYGRLLEAHPGDEIGLVARNNLAGLYFTRGQVERALLRLEPLGDVPEPIRPLFYFNRGVALDHLGRHPEAAVAFDLAMEGDIGSYRITRPYRQVALELGQARAGRVITLDLGLVLTHDDFADYCHPAPAGHHKIFQALAPVLAQRMGLSPGSFVPTLRCIPGNPDRYLGATRSFFLHHPLVATVDEGFTASVLQLARSRSWMDLMGLTSAVEPDVGLRIRGALLRHPLFGHPHFLEKSPPNGPGDQGQLPELYFLRHLVALCRGDHPFHGRDGGLHAYVPRWSRLQTWWAELPPGIEEVPLDVLAEVVTGIDANEILERATSLLDGVISAEPVAHTRYRTITYWFLRESLLFGTPSDHTLYTDRLSLFHVITTCLVMLEFLPPTSPLTLGFHRLLCRVKGLVHLQAQHLGPYASRMYHFGPEARRQYQQALTSAR